MFFSVKTPLKIAGKTYIPCVCYSLPRFLELTVNKLVSEGKAVIYNEFVYFQNGKVIEKTKEIKKETKKKKEVVKENLTTETEKTEESEGF